MGGAGGQRNCEGDGKEGGGGAGGHSKRGWGGGCIPDHWAVASGQWAVSEERGRGERGEGRGGVGGAGTQGERGGGVEVIEG